MIVVFFYLGCSDNISPEEKDYLEINFPIGEKAIYAVGSYTGHVDTLEEYFLSIYSLQFDTMQTSAIGVEYIGEIERYDVLHKVNHSLVYNPGLNQISGKTTVSINDRWVLFQNSELADGFQIFMKTNIQETDTTALPTLVYNQVPMFPNRAEIFSSYSSFRPGSDSLFIGVERNFNFEDYIEWSDVYGTNSGLYYTTEHILKFGNDFTFDFRGILDSNGVVISRSTFESIVTTAESPEAADTLTVHVINRRIVEFNDPDNIKDLSWYGEYVLQNGLTLFGDN
jgi:hypothetical protein